ncbi:RNA-binding protein, LARP1 family Slr1 [Schizosaccharomyces osmophilus]|uniref:RNA-binding protein, LARP1 family Slr1 n=1 Tax=Schizosaccharomyces osmophilus TaxID=2545709 RepID=A0AAE9WBD4_9SCHI|nr:RNA-binding protein, LARP1 family Slr1 [Schizosaccharomyces osmophilus]WBW73080.1 RNA-binding protein, LARP1 family Slr1 [Schizosaccharomyces osmophilus]
MVQDQTLTLEKDQKAAPAAPVNESTRQSGEVNSSKDDVNASNNQKDSAGGDIPASISGETTPTLNDQSPFDSSVNIWAVRREQLSQKAGGSQTEQKQSQQARLQDPNIWPSPELVEQKFSEERKQDPEEKKPLAPKANGKEKWVVITPEISHPPIHSSSKKPSRSRNDGNRRSGSARRKSNIQIYSQSQNQNQTRRQENVLQSLDDVNAPDAVQKTAEQVNIANSHSRNPRRLDDTLRERGNNETSHNNSGFRGRNYRKGYRSKNPNYHPNRTYHQNKVPNVPVVTNPTGNVQYVYDVKGFLTSQIEYYMSIENLCKDMFLRKHMDDEGYVPIAFLASFNRIKSLTSDINLLLSACEASSVVTLHPSFETPIMAKVRRSETWEPWVLPKELRLSFELSDSTAPQPNSNTSSLASSISNLSAAPLTAELNDLSRNMKDDLKLSDANV